MAHNAVDNAPKICVAAHFVGWVMVAATWTVKWWREGPAPSGPLYNSAKEFIGRLDLFVHHTVHEWAMRIATTASTLLSADIGTWYTTSFGVLILLAGTLQWYLLGRFVQWVAERGWQRAALSILAVYGLWLAITLLLWVAA